MVHFETHGNKIYVSKGREGKGSIDHHYNNQAPACRFNLFVLGNKDLLWTSLCLWHKYKDIRLALEKTEIWKQFSEFVC